MNIPAPDITPNVWSSDQMVSVRDLMQDDDFAEFIGDDGDFELDESSGQQPSSVRYLQADEIAMAKLENAKRKNENTEMPGPSDKAQGKLDEKLKEIEDYMNDFNSSTPLSRPQQVWTKSEQVSMDDLADYDPDFEAMLEPNSISKTEPNVQAKRVLKTKPGNTSPAKSTRPILIKPKFDSTEALSMLLDIQNSEETDKFDMLDGFLDKYKIDAPTKKAHASLMSKKTAPAEFPKYKTALQIWKDISSPKSQDTTPTYETSQAIANITVTKDTSPRYCKTTKPAVITQKNELDQMITSNRAVKDDQYWEKRKINNQAAHRSRAKKRKLIEQSSILIQKYEEENPALQKKLDSLTVELDMLQRKLEKYENFEKAHPEMGSISDLKCY